MRVTLGGTYRGGSIPLASQPSPFGLFGVWDSLEARSLGDGRPGRAVRGQRGGFRADCRMPEWRGP